MFVTKLSPSGTALVYSTFLGGTADESGNGIAVDAQGSAYVTGRTASSDFPTSAGAYDSSYNGGTRRVRVQAQPVGHGTRLLDLPGRCIGEEGGGIAVDGQGSAYVTGYTGSPGFPTSAGAYDTSYNGSGDVFVTKLSPSGTGARLLDVPGRCGRRVWQRDRGRRAGQRLRHRLHPLVGLPDERRRVRHEPQRRRLRRVRDQARPVGHGARLLDVPRRRGDDQGSGIAVDGQGSAFVTGRTGVAGLSRRPPAHMTRATTATATGSSPSSPRRARGSPTRRSSAELGEDRAFGVAVDAQGSAYITGWTFSPGFPTSAGAYDTSFNGGGTDGFVTKLAPTGTGLAYSTFLGGTAGDAGSVIAVDGQGRVYVAGYTDSSDFPTSAGAFDTSYNGGRDVFVTKLDMSVLADTSPPDTTITGGPSGLTNGTTHSFSFSSNETGSTFRCRLETPAGPGSEATCSSPQSYTTTANGDYTFFVRAIDAAGNQDATPALQKLTVDTVAPDTTITDGSSEVTDGSAPTFSFSATEAGSRFECKLDVFQACTSPHSLAALGDGDYTFSVQAIDAAGNTDPSPATRGFTVRATPVTPTPPATVLPCARPGRSDGQPIGVTIKGAARYTNSPNVDLTIRPPDAASELFVSNDGGFTRPFTSPLQPSFRYAWSLDSSGPERLPKTVYVRFAGTCVDSSQTFQDDIILDETPPTLRTPSVQAPAKGRRGPLSLTLKAADTLSGVSSVEVRRANAQIFAARYKRKVRLTGSPNKLTVRVRDGAGNNSPWKKVKVVRRKP